MPARSNRKGTLVDTLYYRFEGIELEDGTLTADPEGTEQGAQEGRIAIKTLPIQVRLHKHFVDDSEGKNRPVREVWFSLSCANPKFTVEGPDIEALRQAVWDHMDSKLRVRWENYYLVRVEPAHTLGRMGRGLCFTYENVERGVAHDGTLLLREFRHRNFEIRPWPGEFRDAHNKLMACIPATAQNEAALEEFSDMIDQMRVRLAAFFRPDQIMQTLANLSGLKMLGTPEGED